MACAIQAYVIALTDSYEHGNLHSILSSYKSLPYYKPQKDLKTQKATLVPMTTIHTFDLTFSTSHFLSKYYSNYQKAKPTYPNDTFHPQQKL